MAISVGTTYYSSVGTVYNKGGNVTTGYEVRLKYILNSYSESTNKYNITSTLQMRTTSTLYNTYGNVSATKTVQGVSESLSWLDSWTNTNWRDMYKRTFELTANDDGNLTTKLTGSFNISSYAFSASNAALKSASVSESVEFPTIPRKSDVSCSSFNCGDSTSIIVSKKSDSFTSTIRYKFGSLSGTIVSKTKDKVIPWTPDADDFYEQFPNAKSLKGTVYCDTYNGNTLIGTTEATFTCNAKEDECKPDITLSVIDVNENTKQLTGNENVIVKGISNAKLTSTITYKKSATASSYSASSGDGKKSTSNPATLEGVNSGTFTATATDSRKYSSTATVEKTVENGLLVDYVKLAFATVNIGRPETTSNTINAELKGNYYNDKFSESKVNTIKLTYHQREANGEWSDYIELTPTIIGNTFSFSGPLGTDFDYQKQYEFEFFAEDELMNVSASDKPIIVTKGISIIRVGDGYVDVRGDLRQEGRSIKNTVVGSIYMTSTNENPGSYLGGTWELVDKQFKSFSEYTDVASKMAEYITATSNMTMDNFGILRNGHEIYFRLAFQNTVSLGDSAIKLGELVFNKWGITGLYLGLYDTVAGSDGTDGVAIIDITGAGVINSDDVVPKGTGTTLSSGGTFHIQANMQFPMNYMLDSACDKFYWKRIS